MYQPRFTITNDILKSIGVIDACREVIINAPIVPAWEKQFVEDAMVRTVHYGTAIEGNALTLDQAREVLEGHHIVARDRDIQEVLNYREVIKYIDRLGERIGTGGDKNVPFNYTQDILLRFHSLIVAKVVDHSIGEYRQTNVIIRSVKTGEASYKAPPPVEVPYLIEGLLLWLNDWDSRKLHPVLRAGITHYMMTAIHPFVEGNGRVARAMATLVLFAEDYDIRKLFSLEEHFDQDVERYYTELQKISNQHVDLEMRDLTSWLEYFTQVLAIELTKVREKIRKLSLDDRLKNRVGKQIALSSRQIKLIEYLKEHESLFMRDAKEIVDGVSEDTLLRDFTDLMKKGLVKKVGKTKAARYVLIG